MYGVETVSALSGTLNDGSGGNLYFPQLLCGFLISARTFSQFVIFLPIILIYSYTAENNSVIRIAYTGGIEAGFDFVTVYDGSDANARRSVSTSPSFPPTPSTTNNKRLHYSKFTNTLQFLGLAYP